MMGQNTTLRRSSESLAGRVLGDLDVLIDNAHDFFDKLEEIPWVSLPLRALTHARLVTHEWLANLVQHADFRDRAPHVTIRVELEHSRLRFIVDDNSTGFDFYGQLKSQAEQLGALPNRGMGLLMIGACSDELAYQRLRAHWNRLTFTVGAGEDPLLDIPLHGTVSGAASRAHVAAA